MVAHYAPGASTEGHPAHQIAGETFVTPPRRRHSPDDWRPSTGDGIIATGPPNRAKALSTWNHTSTQPTSAARTTATPDPIADWKRRNPQAPRRPGRSPPRPVRERNGRRTSSALLPGASARSVPGLALRSLPRRVRPRQAPSPGGHRGRHRVGHLRSTLPHDRGAFLRRPTGGAAHRDRERAIDTWLSQATQIEILNGLVCGCYTPRELARAVARRGLGLRFDTARAINLFCLPEWWAMPSASMIRGTTTDDRSPRTPHAPRARAHPLARLPHPPRTLLLGPRHHRRRLRRRRRDHPRGKARPQ